MADSLIFAPERYSVQHYSYQGQDITYRFYENICYVAHPVDITYQTMNIKVPVSIGGKAIDASRAPIFFGIGCAGFLSTTAASGGSFGPPPGAGPEGPGAPPKKASEITSSEEWEAMAGGEGHAGGGIMGMPLLGAFQPAPPAPGPGEPGEMAPPDGSRWGKLALGFVVVEAGCRGRENQFPDGTYYGKAPAAVVDLKAAIRYIRHNRGRFPGDPEKIITTGGSGGGWQSTLLGASGNCKWFAPYLEELGAAEERDDIFISYSTSPIIDHEHMDGGIEWQGGSLLTDPQAQAISAGFAEDFAGYLASSQFYGKDGQRLSIDDLGDYIAKTYLAPDAARYLQKLPPEARAVYLADRPWLHWDGAAASFTFEDFGRYAPRSADVPSVDDMALSQPAPNLYGNAHTAAQHYTARAMAIATGDPAAVIPESLTELVHSQNPTWHILQHHSDVAPHWWIRHGACDSCTSVAPVVLLASAAEAAGKDVNLRLVWDGGHCEDDDHPDFLRWVQDITDYHI